MSKTNKKLIVLSLEILVILAFGIIAFMARENALAYYDENGSYYLTTYENFLPTRKVYEQLSIAYITPNAVDSIDKPLTITITGTGFAPDSVAKKNGSNRPTTFIDSKHLLVTIYPGEIPSSQSEFFLTVSNQNNEKHSNAVTFTIRDNKYNTGTNTNKNTSSQTTSYNYQSNKVVSKISEEVKKVNREDVNEGYRNTTANALYGSNSFMPTGIVQWIFAVILILVIIYLWRYVHRDEYMKSPMKHA